MIFIDTLNRKRKSLTLARPYKGKTVSITLRTGGKRKIDLSDTVCLQYAEALDALMSSGELIPILE